MTGTDTGVGKTRVACALLHAIAARGHRCVGFKPVAAGCARVGAVLRNEDALALCAASNVDPRYEQVNPIALEPPVAPHLAAADVGEVLSVQRLVAAYRELPRADFCVIEGAGGWLVPLNERETLADLALALAAPVMLVVAVRLGCLNHALLSAQSIRGSGLPLAGWVANRALADTARADDNVAALSQRLGAPCADLSYAPRASPVACTEALAQCAARLTGVRPRLARRNDV